MRVIRFSAAVIFFLGLSSVSLAQPDRPIDPDVPITGIEILIGLGGALGIRKLIVAKRSKSSEK